MNEYIETVMTHMGSYPFAWDVVNEAIGDGPHVTIKPSPWAQIDDFICKAFQAARKAQPQTQLFYNDYAHASMQGGYKMKSDKVYNLVKDLVDRNCGIDGVGFQLHVDITYNQANIDSIQQNI